MIEIQRIGNCVRVLQTTDRFVHTEKSREVAFFTCYDRGYAEDTAQEVLELLAILNVEVKT